MTAPKLRFKAFDGDWSNKKIDEIAVVTSGGTPSRNISKYWNGHIPWVTTSLVDFNIINNADEFITQDGVDNSSAKLFPKNTILMAMYGQGITRGKVAILGIDATTNQACAAIKLKDGIDTNFIFQNLMSRYEEIRDLSNEGGQKNLSAGIIKDISISYPSKPEQTKIASFLSAVDEKISQLTQKHELLSQYKQGMMQKLFSQQIRFKADDGSEFGEWEDKILKDLFPKIRNGFVGVATPYYVNYGVKYLQGKNIKNGKIDATGLIFINQEFHQKKTNSTLKTNDILMVQSGHVGECAVVTEDYDNANCHALLVLSPKSSKLINSKFVVYYFYSEIGKKKIALIKTGNTIEHILASDIKEVALLFPCLAEQTKIANFLSAIDQKIEVVAQQIEHAKQWKKGLLQQMFV